MLLIGYVIGASSFVNAETHHVIVLLDKSGDMYHLYRPSEGKGEAETQTLLKAELTSLCFDAGEIIPERALLQQADYLSVLYFGLAGDAINFDDFIQEITPDHRYIYTQTSYHEIFMDIWNTISQDAEQQGRKNFATNSGAITWGIPLALSYVGAYQAKMPVHKTFLLMVSNGRFNSSGAHSEEASIKKYQPNLDFTKANRSYKHIVEYFEIKEISFVNTSKLITLYEIIPKMTQQQLQTWFTSPAMMQLHRTKDDYKGVLPIEPQNTPQYEFMEMFVKQVRASDEKILEEKSFERFPAQYELTFPLQAGSEQYTLDIEYEVRLNDGIYDAQVLYAHSNLYLGPDEGVKQIPEGFTRQITLSFEPEEKVFGQIALTDWMWDAGAYLERYSQRQVVQLWEYAFSGGGIGFLVIVMLWIYKRSKTPIIITNWDDIKAGKHLKKK